MTSSKSELRGIVVHLCFTIFGCAISLRLLVTFNVVMTLPQHRYDDAASILNPVFWLPSLFVGLMINRIVRHQWAGIAPATAGALVIVIVAISDLSRAHGHVWRNEFGLLFSPVSSVSSDKAGRALAQLFFTFPFLSSVAYSLGAWLAMRFGDGHPLRATNTIK